MPCVWVENLFSREEKRITEACQYCGNMKNEGDNSDFHTYAECAKTDIKLRVTEAKCEVKFLSITDHICKVCGKPVKEHFTYIENGYTISFGDDDV